MSSPTSDRVATRPLDASSGQRTLADLVAEVPARARVFESLQFDYCCHGQQTLAEVCRQRGRGVDEVVGLLAQAPTTSPFATHDGRDWREATVGELIDHIERVHHAYLRKELPRLEQLTAKVAGHHGDSDPRLLDLSAVFKLLFAELEMHMIKEEQVLFPLGRQLAEGLRPEHHCGSVRNPVAAMLAEHDDAGNSLARMRRLTDGFVPPASACPTYREMLSSLEALEADLHLHIHEENNILFPRLVACEKAIG